MHWQHICLMSMENSTELKFSHLQVRHGALYVNGVAQEEDFVADPPTYTTKLTVRPLLSYLSIKMAYLLRFLIS